MSKIYLYYSLSFLIPKKKILTFLELTIKMHSNIVRYQISRKINKKCFINCHYKRGSINYFIHRSPFTCAIQ